jgi:uncharacterized membrane protein YphA (DoxX/SURF4 family)
MSPASRSPAFQWRAFSESRAPAAVVLIRVAVGVIFASEGLLKCIYPSALGTGRFAKIGIPMPEVTGPFIAGVELVCGLLMLGGVATRLAAVPLIADMIVAICSTKVPALLGHGYWLFANTLAPKSGIWDFLHESRADISMLLSSAFLLMVGAGPWSIDAVAGRRDNQP